MADPLKATPIANTSLLTMVEQAVKIHTEMAWNDLKVLAETAGKQALQRATWSQYVASLALIVGAVALWRTC